MKITKSVLSILITFWAQLYAQPSQLINYQGKLVNQAGEILTGKFSVQFSIYTDSAGGKLLWNETRDVEAINGLFSILLGSVSAFPDTLFSGRGTRYLVIKIGTDPEMKPRMALTSVPYALHAQTTLKLSPPDGDPANAVSVDDQGNLSIPHSGLQLAGTIHGIGIYPGNASPDAAYLRFGDKTGWKFHITRAYEGAGAEPNTGNQGAILTVKDNGYIGIGTTEPLKPLHLKPDNNNPIIIQNGYASSDRAKELLSQLPAPSFIIGGPWQGSIYFYWSFEIDGKKRYFYSHLSGTELP